MSDHLFRGSMEDVDPSVYQLTQIEAERQFKKLILIPSESSSPKAVREALSTTFHNIYAEGYPEEASRYLTEEEILDYQERMPYYRRYSDPRYYKGVEYANVVEALARRRAAEAASRRRGLGERERSSRSCGSRRPSARGSRRAGAAGRGVSRRRPGRSRAPEREASRR